VTIALFEYGVADWLRMRPVTHAIKAIRYARIDRHHLLQLPERIDAITEVVTCLKNTSQVLITIAFNDPELIELQIKAVKRFIPGTVHLIVDNSSDKESSKQIDQICREKGTVCIRIDENPWNRRNFSRSHGYAMNWTWRHVIQPIQPDQFGFIDHDLIPTKPTDPFVDLQGLPFYGDKRWSGDRWYLWAGFCLFRLSSVSTSRLDFGVDWFIGLDTGGGNWSKLYRNFDSRKLRDRHIVRSPVEPDMTVQQAYFEWRDDWIHEVGLHGDASFKSHKRKIIRQIVDQSLRITTKKRIK
jgi:hypothetical protein